MFDLLSDLWSTTDVIQKQLDQAHNIKIENKRLKLENRELKRRLAHAEQVISSFKSNCETICCCFTNLPNSQDSFTSSSSSSSLNSSSLCQLLTSKSKYKASEVSRSCLNSLVQSDVKVEVDCKSKKKRDEPNESLFEEQVEHNYEEKIENKEQAIEYQREEEKGLDADIDAIDDEVDEFIVDDDTDQDFYDKVLSSLVVDGLQCPMCSQKFTKRSSTVRHLIKQHGLDEEKMKIRTYKRSFSFAKLSP